jgi:hypothetical protein
MTDLSFKRLSESNWLQRDPVLELFVTLNSDGSPRPRMEVDLGLVFRAIALRCESGTPCRHTLTAHQIAWCAPLAVVFPTLWDASVALAGPCSVRGYCGETACAPVLMANVAPPVPTGIDGIDRSTRISRVAQGAGHEPECFLGRGGGHGRWSTKANGGHAQHCLTITGYPLYRNAHWWRARVAARRRPRASILERAG